MKRIITLICCLCTFLFAGCSLKESVSESSSGRAPFVLSYPESLQKQGFPDALCLEKRPKRVVTLTNSPVLALYELGVNQVGVPDTKILAWPQAIKEKATLFQTGMRSQIDLESVIALSPDLVIVGVHAKDTYGKQLEAEKIPVYYVDAGPTVTYEDVKAMTLILASAFDDGSGKKDAIRNRFEKAEEMMKEARSRYDGKKVLILQGAPPRFYVQNEAGTVGSMFSLLGFKNVVGKGAGPMVPLKEEEAFSYEPDLIVFVSGMGGGDETKVLMEKEFAARPFYWNEFRAVKNGQLVYLPRRFAVSGGLEEVEQIKDLVSLLDAVPGAGK